MKNSSKILYLAFVCLVGLSCVVQPPSTTQTTNDSNKRVATDSKNQNLEGIYFATISCDNCEVIQMTVEIKKDNTFSLEKTFKDKAEVLKQQGTFEWNSSESMLKFIPNNNSQPSYYLVGDNQIIPLDPNGKLLSSTEAKKYLLKKIK